MSNSSSSNWTTNVNRAKTKRWVEAKSYSYDGDDWGDADEYGEYDEPQAAPKPTGLRKATAPAATLGSGQTGDPAAMAERERSNSFGRGDERRAFSGPPTRTAYAQPQPTTYHQQQNQVSSPQELSQPHQWPTNTPQNVNNPRAPIANVPATYDNRAMSTSSASAASGAIPMSGRRQPVMGQAEQPPALDTIVTPPTIGQDRETPTTPTFIRPADIYRRIAEEREKERLSQESSRPSLSGLTREESPAGKSDISGKSGRQAQNTASVAAPSPFNPSTDVSKAKGPSNSPLLPEIGGLSGFGDDFGGSFMTSSPLDHVKKATSAETPKAPTTAVVAPPSVLPDSMSTSAHQQSSLQQPSAGYKTVVNQAFADAVPPTPSSGSGSGIDRSNSDSTNQISPIISREVSNAVRPEGMSNIASIAEEPAGSSQPNIAGVGSKQPQVKPVSKTSERIPVLESAQQLTTPQQAELAATTPSSATPSVARDRSLSPSKNRVRDLVDQIDSAGNSRRGSQTSLGDQATTPQAQRPNFEPKESFRPSIPGGWQSYTTNQPPVQASSPRQRSPVKKSAETTTQTSEQNEDAFTKAAAAGSALAGAFAAAAGAVVSTVSGNDSESQGELERPRRASKVNTAFHPEAARLPLPRQESDVASSIVPTPLEMKPQSNTQPEYFNTVQPLQQKQPGSAQSTLDVPQVRSTDIADDMSTRSSPTDLESDRLRKEIVRELSPQRDEPAKQEPEQPQDEAYDPAIYDSYLTEDDTLSRKPSEANALDKSVATAVAEPMVPKHNPHDSTVPIFSSTSGPLEDIPMPMTATTETDHSLTRQFSWEGPSENLAASLGTTPVAVRQAPPELHSPTEPEKPRFVASASKSDHHRTPSQPLDINKQLPLAASPADEQLSPQVSHQTSTPPQHFSQQDSTETILPPAPGQKVPAFREIMAIQSTAQRIQTYDQTRQTFANMETGLVQWIQATINSLPEHEDVLSNGGIFPIVVRPPPVPGATTKPQLQSSVSRPSLGPGKSVKGKDILASAGVFGGKANSAAKGLFAKGKSKWGRSADKVD